VPLGEGEVFDAAIADWHFNFDIIIVEPWVLGTSPRMTPVGV
jgi:hypothetical protein